MPDEAMPCGGSFAEHAGAHLAAIKAVADHQLAHLRPPVGLVNATYRSVSQDLANSDGHTAVREGF
jgi:hypothetical protein